MLLTYAKRLNKNYLPILEKKFFQQGVSIQSNFKRLHVPVVIWTIQLYVVLYTK